MDRKDKLFSAISKKVKESFNLIKRIDYLFSIGEDLSQYRSINYSFDSLDAAGFLKGLEVVEVEMENNTFFVKIRPILADNVPHLNIFIGNLYMDIERLIKKETGITTILSTYKEELYEAHPYYSSKNVYNFKNDKVIALNKMLKFLLKRKFDWFIDIQIMFLETTKTNIKVPKLNGIIKVNEDWYGSQWREYNWHSNPPPNPNIEDISIGDIVGGELAKEISQEIIKGLQMIISTSVEGFQWFNLFIRTEEKKDIMTEDIQREDIDNQVLNFLRRRAKKEVKEVVGFEIIQVTFEGTDLVINSLQSKKQNELELKLFLADYNLFDLDDYHINQRDPKHQKVIRTIRYFINEIMN